MMTEITAKALRDIFEEEGINPQALQSLVVQALRERGKKVATAESCTGGLLSQRITQVSGASEVFDCGVCSYANFIKHKLLGVEEETLNTRGAVSPQTAREMALGVKKLAGADYGVSTTGIAGPCGGTREKPVGLVYIGVSAPFETYAVRTLLEEENSTRESIRELASHCALYALLKEIRKTSVK